jgi:spoIIIJ-associated protein
LFNRNIETMKYETHRGPAEKITDFLQTLTTTGGLDLKFQILACNGQVQPNSSNPAGEASLTPNQSNNSAPPGICVEFTGPDTPLLTARNGELLLSIEHIAAKILRLEPENHDQVSFDAGNFKASRDRAIHESAEAAVQKVRDTGQPYAFPPMTSRERRLLHLALAVSGLVSASSGEGPRRCVVLYPEDYQPAQAAPAPPPTPERARAIRNAFRRR